jgi:hypothetical protein
MESVRFQRKTMSFLSVLQRRSQSTAKAVKTAKITANLEIKDGIGLLRKDRKMQRSLSG